MTLKASSPQAEDEIKNVEEMEEGEFSPSFHCWAVGFGLVGELNERVFVWRCNSLVVKDLTNVFLSTE